MPIKDKVVKEIEVVYDGVFDTEDFLDFLKKWFKEHRYDVEEKEYETKGRDEIKSLLIKWSADRKPTDYDKYYIKLKITGTDFKKADLEGKQVVEGKIKVEFEAEHEKDYEEKWRKRPNLNFFRAVYDKFINEEKEGRIAKKLKDDTLDLRNEVKQYFNVE